MALLLVAVAATAVIAPMFFLGNASGHDFQFHLASWLDVAGQWREGIFFPRWAEWANWGYGEPRFIFYPPGSWMLGATLGSLLPWRMAPGAFIWLALLLAGYSMWRFAREWLTPREAAAAAVLYAVNPYHLIIVYYRSDFAELLASALLPLALWGTVRLLREGWRGLQFLAVPFALIWLANAPAAVLATYSLMLLFFVASILRRSLRPLLLGGVSMAAGFGLAAFYIFPAAYEQRWVQIHQALADLLSPDQNFLFTHAIDPEFLIFNWKVSGVAMGVMLITGIAAVIVCAPPPGISGDLVDAPRSRRRRSIADVSAQHVFVALAAQAGICAVSLALAGRAGFRVRVFPRRSHRTRQAPVARRPRDRNRSRDAGRRPGVTTAGGTAKTFLFSRKGIQSGRGYEGTDEYQPLGCDRYELPGSDPGRNDRRNPHRAFSSLIVETHVFKPAPDDTVHIERWTANEKRFADARCRARQR